MVAVLDGRFEYFCSIECKRSTSALSVSPPPVALRPPPSPSAAVQAHDDLPNLEPPGPRSDAVADGASLPVDEGVVSSRRQAGAVAAASASVDLPERREGATRTAAVVLAVLALAFGVVDTRSGAPRLSLATAAALMLGALFAMQRVRARGRERHVGTELAVDTALAPSPIAAPFAAVIAVIVAWGVTVAAPPSAPFAIATAIWIVLASAVAESIAYTSTRATVSAARELMGHLRHGSEDGARAPRVGDVLALSPGVRVTADLRVQSGEVVAELWGNSALPLRRGEGDALPAGAVVRDGQGTARVTAVGRDRAFARLLADMVERAGQTSARLRAVHRWTPLAAAAVVLLTLAVGIATRGGVVRMLVASLAAGLSIVIPPARRLAVRDHLWGVVEACRRGAVFRDTHAFARAAHVRTAVFCARGTLIATTPETCDAQSFGGAPGSAARRAGERDASGAPDASGEVGDAATVLAIAAGAELAVTHPIAAAIQRAAHSRGVRPRDVRGAAYEAGLGVRGELASGGSIVVGSRVLCLREHVATAEHEATIAELGASGREIVLVARDGRLIGFLSLQYALRAGALAAVQRLHDIEVEPVIVGAASRERLVAIGRAIDVEHVRPEVLGRDRAAEVRRISQSGGPVAVIGRPSLDGGTLAAADLPIALGDAGAAQDGPEQWAVGLAHDHLVAAADVLALAQMTRARIAATLVVGLAPVALAALPVVFALTRPTIAPIAALAASIALGVRDLVAAALPEGARMEDTSYAS